MAKETVILANYASLNHIDQPPLHPENALYWQWNQIFVSNLLVKETTLSNPPIKWKDCSTFCRSRSPHKPSFTIIGCKLAALTLSKSLARFLQDLQKKNIAEDCNRYNAANQTPEESCFC
jgi:hypothetical protein